MHQRSSWNVLPSILIVCCSVFSLSHGGAIMKPGPSVFGSSVGGWTVPISSSTSTGISGVTAVQQGDSGQTLTLQASGQGMIIGLSSNVGSDGFTNVAQNGGNSGPISAEVNSASVTSGIVPVSAIQLDVLGTDNMTLELDTHALGWEQVDSLVEQQTHVSSDQSGGWGAVSGGWPAVPSLQNGRNNHSVK